jgi:penicillin-binding protein 1C
MTNSLQKFKFYFSLSTESKPKHKVQYILLLQKALQSIMKKSKPKSKSKNKTRRVKKASVSKLPSSSRLVKTLRRRLSKIKLKPFFLDQKKQAVSKLKKLFNKISKKSLKKPIKTKSKKTRATKHLGNHKLKILIGILTLLSLFILSIFVYYLKDLPSPRRLESDEFAVSTQIFDRNGALLYEIYSDTQRTPINLEDIPDHVIHATLAIEDSGFYRHLGFSAQGIIRATRNTLFRNQLQGGSTITQQLVKTALLTPERTIERKIKEAILTIGTEITYSKDQILEMYLNHIPYGGTSYGIESAAKRYFNIPARQLNLAQASILAGLPQAPTRFSPFYHPERAKARQHEVLRRMVEEGYITAQEADNAFQTNLEFATPAINIDAPHFVFYVKNLLEEKYGLHTVERGGLRVTTTLDLELQNYAQASVSAEIADLENQQVSNGAALVTKPNTGEILAMIGSINYFDTQNDGQVNIATRLRQPGSSIKPINYVTALQNGLMTPSTMILDIPTCFQVVGQPLYCPRNYDNSFRGPVLFRQALANSYNIPAVKILAINDIDSMVATASAMGIQSFTDTSRFGLALTLGGGEVTMLDMATAFGTLANQGVKVNLNPILEITNHTGEVLESFDPQTTLTALDRYFDQDNQRSNVLGINHQGLERVLNREPTYLISDILADNQARSAAFGSRSALYIPDKYVSVKTGTTNDLRDNWTIGYTSEYLVTTWVGNNDNTPMNRFIVSGVTGAAPIWNSIMTHLLRDSQDSTPPEPPGITRRAVCSLSGNIPTQDQPCDTRSEIFWDQYLPRHNPLERKSIWINRSTGLPAFYGSNVGDTTPEEEITDELELREHTVISDPFTQEFCLDCHPPEDLPEEARSSFPRTIVNMSTFRPDPNP